MWVMLLRGIPKTSIVHRSVLYASTQSPASSTTPDSSDPDEFRTLQVRPSRERPSRPKRRSVLYSSTTFRPRVSRMNPDSLDWKSIWPGPRTFAPHSVPLPVRQGVTDQVPHDKYANMELMKIPNFLHLTPPAIKAHCEELKKFCTPFPEELNSKAMCEKHFPMTIVTNDYLHSSPSIRDPLARVVTIKIKLSDIPLDEHARDKLLRLVGYRYNPETDTLTIVTDRCPFRKQNYDYAQYLLTALFFESWKTEPWEAEKSEADMEKYVWETSDSAKRLAGLLSWNPEKPGALNMKTPLAEKDLKPEHRTYSRAVTKIVEGETDESIREYKDATTRLLLGNTSQKKTASAMG